jgi:hypothetical protein
MDTIKNDKEFMKNAHAIPMIPMIKPAEAFPTNEAALFTTENEPLTEANLSLCTRSGRIEDLTGFINAVNPFNMKTKIRANRKGI